MLSKLILFFVVSVSPLFSYSIDEIKRESYARKMQQGFFLQSLGKTRAAFYTFKEGYQEALQLNESRAKLGAVNDLFIWYRTYGYSAGVMLHPANCQGEYHSPRSPLNSFSTGSDYQSEWGKTPEQAKYIRQFMLGVGLFISGIFAVTINPPFFGPLGKSMLVTGFTQMYLGLNNGWAEWETRVHEVQMIERRTEGLPDTK